LAQITRAQPRTDAAQVQGAILAADLIEHQLNNQLARLICHCELVADDPRLPEDLKERVTRALTAAYGASETLDKFLGVLRVELKSLEIVDLARSGGQLLVVEEAATP
jgi:hypothetical protein